MIVLFGISSIFIGCGFFEDDNNQLLHEQLVSPDIMEGIDGEDRRQVAREKRM